MEQFRPSELLPGNYENCTINSIHVVKNSVILYNNCIKVIPRNDNICWFDVKGE